MDIARPDQKKKKRRKLMLYAVAGVVLLGLAGFGLSRMQPAAPQIERATVWIDTVKRGEMLRQVRGLGTLTPEEIRWVAAHTQGRVDKILLRPGATVTTDSVILVLVNPEVTRLAADADSQVKAAEAELVNLRTTLESQLLASESAAASAKAAYEAAKLRAEVNAQLLEQGLVSRLDYRLSAVNAAQAATQNEIEQKRFAFAQRAMGPQVAVKETEVERLRAQAKLRHDDLDALNVRSDLAGVLQVLPLDVGQQVQPGTNLARVANPSKLKAEIRIAETQAKDIVVGQTAEIDTRNGVVKGMVARIDPSVQNGTVLVDVSLVGELPKGARPDLSVDGTVELERLPDVAYVGRPAFGAERGTVGIFKLDPDGIRAHRVQVTLGRGSVNAVEVIRGLAAGDRVILSDMSQWDGQDVMRIK